MNFSLLIPETNKEEALNALSRVVLEGADNAEFELNKEHLRSLKEYPTGCRVRQSMYTNT